MGKNFFLRLALPTPLRRLFDYLPPQVVDPQALIPGVRVLVPFQSRSLIGILVDVVQETTVSFEKLKRASEVLDESPIFSRDIYQLCQWAGDYYHYSLGEVLGSALPTLLRKGKKLPEQRDDSHALIKRSCADEMELNPQQQQALTAINQAKGKFNVFLLDGVTGSGKTEVYLRAMREILNEDKQVLVLVPEISLTPQTIERFRCRFDQPMVALHSSLSEKERLHAWLAARTGDAKIVIGTRSAIFTPFTNLGLIIVDEEHDTSFKQQDRFRYHARDLAIMRANINQIPIVLGSATPSLESLLNVKRNRYASLLLPKRAGMAELPQYKLLDIRQGTLNEGLSEPLIKAMHEQLAQDNQVMLFLNRRGFAPVLYCTQCCYIAGCSRCDARMVYHRKPPRLQCHHCDAQTKIPEYCPQCKNVSLQPIGLGTQRLEQMLEAHFPDVPIIRVDRDNTRRKGAMQNLLEQINTQKKAILVGTQMLAKGHHFPCVTLVGIVDADSGLFSVDFRALEQMGQLLVQVAGRAGRGEKPGTVYIQTRHPEHPLLQTLLQQGYPTFAKALLAEREQAILPPYAYFAVFRAEAYAKETANQFLLAIKEMSSGTDAITILGPVPALLAKRKGFHCLHLLIKATQRSALQKYLKMILQKIEKLPASHSVKWTLDVDPVEVI